MFVVTWESQHTGENHMYARVFQFHPSEVHPHVWTDDKVVTPITDEFQVNLNNASYFQNPEVCPPNFPPSFLLSHT